MRMEISKTLKDFEFWKIASYLAMILNEFVEAACRREQARRASLVKGMPSLNSSASTRPHARGLVMVAGHGCVGRTYIARECSGYGFAFHGTDVADGDARVRRISFNQGLHKYGGTEPCVYASSSLIN